MNKTIWNVPNVLTMFRVVFSIGIFCLVPFGLYIPALVFFILAAVTDFLDGWWARKYKQVTVFGRIMDPFADKLLVCGTFICLLGAPRVANVPHWYFLQPWMVVVIVARELWITSLRAFVEKEGGDFSAKWIGKWKMALQCVCLPAILLYLALLPTGSALLSPAELPNPFIFWTVVISLWGTVAITVYSGLTYTVRAFAVIGRD